ASGGGVFSGSGLDVAMEVDPNTSVSADDGADIEGTKAVSLTSTAIGTATAAGNSGNYGGIVVIMGGATSTLRNTNTATIGVGTTIKSGLLDSLTVRSDSTNDAETGGDAGGGAAVPILRVTDQTNATDQTTTTIGTSAALTAGTDMSVESRTSTTGKAAPTS